MPRYFPNAKITFTTTVRDENGTLTNASAITFKWKSTINGSETSETPTNTSTGVYSVTITPTTGGNLYYRWDTDGALDVAKEGVINIAPTEFP